MNADTGTPIGTRTMLRQERKDRMIWSMIFAGVAGVCALFGFGVLAEAEMAQVLTVVFGLLSLGGLALWFTSDGQKDWPGRRS